MLDINAMLKKLEDLYEINEKNNPKYSRQEVSYFFLWQHFRERMQKQLELIKESINTAEGVEQFLISSLEYVLRQMDEEEATCL